MGFGLVMIQELACQNQVGKVLTLFAPRPQDPQAPFAHPLGSLGLVFGAPHLPGVLQGSRRVSVPLLRARMWARAQGWKHPSSERS